MTETEVDIVDDIVDEAVDRADSLLVNDVVMLVERYDPAAIESDSFGVSKGRVLQYAEAFPSEDRMPSPDEVRTALSERTVESESWVGGDTLYVVDDDHVSLYPRSWHEALEGEDDLVRYAEFVLADVGDSTEAFDQGGQSAGIPENELVAAAATLGPLSWEEAEQEVERLRDEGVFAETLDQHPTARVRLADVDHD